MNCVIYWFKIGLSLGTHLLAIYYDPSPQAFPFVRYEKS